MSFKPPRNSVQPVHNISIEENPEIELDPNFNGGPLRSMKSIDIYESKRKLEAKKKHTLDQKEKIENYAKYVR